MKRLWYALQLSWLFLMEIVVSNFKVAWVVFTPGIDISPKLVPVPLELKTDRAITVLAYLITLTPDTLAVDISDDRSEMLVHYMFAEEDTQQQVAQLKQTYERLIREVFE